MNAAETLTPRYLADPFGEVLLGRRILLRAAEDRLRLDRLRNAVGSTFFPWAHHPTGQAPRGPRFAHSSRGKKASLRKAEVSPPPSSAPLRPLGCVVDRPRPLDRHRGRGGRGLEDSKEKRHG